MNKEIANKNKEIVESNENSFSPERLPSKINISQISQFGDENSVKRLLKEVEEIKKTLIVSFFEYN